jgi:hypothetical protein
LELINKTIKALFLKHDKKIENQLLTAEEKEEQKLLAELGLLFLLDFDY